MAKELLSKGLAHFAAGELEQATRAWLAAQRVDPDHPQLRAYLSHIRALDPELYERVSEESHREEGVALPGDGTATPGEPTLRTVVTPEQRRPLSVPLPIPTPPPGLPPAAPPAASLAAPPAAPRTQTARVPYERPRTIPPPDVLGGKPLYVAHQEAGEKAQSAPTLELTDLQGPPSAAVVQPAVSAPAQVFPPAQVLSQPSEQLPEQGPMRPPAFAGFPGLAQAPSGSDPWGPPTDTDEVQGGDGLELLNQQPSPPPLVDGDLSALEGRLRELVELDDFTGAVEVADAILAHRPGHLAAREARRAAASKLQAMYVSKIGDVTRVPRVLLTPDELIWLDLDHKSGFVLAQIDGVSSYEEIVAVTGMGELESFRIMAKLVQEGVIGP